MRYENDTPILRAQKEIMSSLLKWGCEGLGDEGVTENDFDNEILREIFVKLKAVNYNTGILLTEYAEYDMEMVRFIAMLAESAMYSSPTTFRDYLKLLRDLTSRARLKLKLSECLMIENLSVEYLQSVVDEEIKIMPSVSSECTAERYIESLTTKPEVLNTKYGVIDGITGGIRVPSLFIIGARPSTGKTTFAINAALRARTKAVIFSLEMNAEQIYNRMSSIACRIPYSDILNRNLNEEQHAAIKKFITQWKEWIIVIDDVYNIDNIAINIRKLKPKLAVVDYIQIVGSSGKEKSLRERMNDVATELRIIAKQNNCCIIALSQITRDGKNKPTMSDLMESGALEANADYVMLMHRPYTVDKTDPDAKPEDTHMIIDKNRYGRTGVVYMSFDGKNQTFTEVDENHVL